MTRKDYVLIASALREVYHSHTDTLIRSGVLSAADSIASALANDNPRFDRARFCLAVIGMAPRSVDDRSN